MSEPKGDYLLPNQQQGTERTIKIFDSHTWTVTIENQIDPILHERRIKFIVSVGEGEGYLEAAAKVEEFYREHVGEEDAEDYPCNIISIGNRELAECPVLV